MEVDKVGGFHGLMIAEQDCCRPRKCSVLCHLKMIARLDQWQRRRLLVWLGSFVGFFVSYILAAKFELIGFDLLVPGMSYDFVLGGFPPLTLRLSITWLLLTWPLLFARSFAITAMGMLLLFLVLGSCLINSKPQEACLVLLMLPGLEVSMALIYWLRGRFRDLELVETHTIHTSAKLLAFGFFLGLVLVVVTLAFLYSVFAFE